MSDFNSACRLLPRSVMLLCNKLPQNLTAQNSILFWRQRIPVAQESRCSFLGSSSGSGCLTRLQSKCQLGLWLHLTAQQGENPLRGSCKWLLAGLRSGWPETSVSCVTWGAPLSSSQHGSWLLPECVRKGVRVNKDGQKGRS